MKFSESSEINAVSKSSNPNSNLSFSKEEVKRDQKKEQKQKAGNFGQAIA